MMNAETFIELSQTNHQDIISYISAFQSHTSNGFCNAEKVKELYRYEDVHEQQQHTSKIHFCTNRTILNPCKEQNKPYTYEHFEL